MSDRKVFIQYSKDGGRTWGNWRERSLGEIGEYEKRIRLNRLGGVRNRIFRIRVSSPIRRDLLGAVGYLVASSG